jgi:hypothetical protein
MSFEPKSTTFNVDRSIPVWDTIKALKFSIYGELFHLDTAPTHSASVIQVNFFSLLQEGYDIPADKLRGKYLDLNLFPDIQVFLQFAEAYPEFADKTPHAMQWHCGRNDFAYIVFRRWIGGKFMSICRHHEVRIQDYVLVGCHNELGT